MFIYILLYIRYTFSTHILSTDVYIYICISKRSDLAQGPRVLVLSFLFLYDDRYNDYDRSLMNNISKRTYATI